MSKNSIPVLGAAIVNGAHWLHKLISSVDYPVDNFLIVNKPALRPSCKS